MSSKHAGPRAAFALCLALAAWPHAARAQGSAAPAGAGRKLEPRVVAAIPGYRGPSGVKGLPALAAFSPDGRLFALSGEKQVVNLYEAATGKLLHTLSTTRTGGLDAFSFSPDGRTAATRDREDKAVRLWDVETGRELRALAGRRRNIETKWKANDFNFDAFLPVPFGPGGRAVLVEREDDLVTVFEAGTGREVSVLDHKTETNTGKTLLMAALTGKLRLLHMRPVMSPDGRLVVTANGDKFPKLWDAATGRLVATLGDHRDVVYNAAFSPDSRLVATETSAGAVHLWEAETGQFRAKLKAEEIDYSYFNAHDLYFAPSFAFSPDARRLVTYHDRRTQVWDAETGALRHPLKKAEAETAVFSPDSKTLATSGGGSASAKLWDAETGRLIRQLPKAERDSRRVLFSADGRLLLTASEAGVRLWDAETGDLLATLARSRFPFSLSPDGRRLVTGGNGQTALLYELSR